MIHHPHAGARSRDSWTSSVLKGAAAGFLATAPMTVAMVLLHRQLPRRQRYPLPPSLITRNLERKARVRHKVDADEHVAATLASHFGYGSAAGALYGAAEPRVPGPAVAKGIGYGLLVWAGSYLGILPVLGLLAPATQIPARRNALMVAAHVVWGAALGFLVDRLKSTSAPPASPVFARTEAEGEKFLTADSSSFRESSLPEAPQMP